MPAAPHPSPKTNGSSRHRDQPSPLALSLRDSAKVSEPRGEQAYGATTAASTNHSFSHPPHALALDEERRRCVNLAFHISFHGNPRVKHKPTYVELPNGASFLIVDRFVSGNSDGVYEKNKKIWEQIPVGQARVFAPPPSANVWEQPEEDSVEETVTANSTGVVDEIEKEMEDTPSLLTSPALVSSVSMPRFSPTLTSPTATQSLLNQAPPFASNSDSATLHIGGSNNANNSNDWTCVASVVGLRKMGHWRAATTVYSLHKELARSVIALEKVDGEPGHVAAFTWLGQRYWVIGCRYQHIVTRLDVPEADLLRYTSSSGSVGGVNGHSNSSGNSSDANSDASSATTAASPASLPIRTAASNKNKSNTDSAAQDFEQSSVHSNSYTAVTTLGGATIGQTSEAGYLDLAVRMARLWRHVLESLSPSSSAIDVLLAGSAGGAAAASIRTTAGSTEALEEKQPSSSPPHARHLARLHHSVASDQRTLCFDAILSGWERLQSFTASHDFSPDASTVGEETPQTPSSPLMTRATSATFRGSPSVTAGTWEAEIPLWFYAVTWDKPLEGRGWCMPVQLALDFFAAAGLPVIPASAEVERGSPAYEALWRSVLSRCDTAGAVLYGSNADVDADAEGQVVQVWKCRAYPHTLERVVQEYVVTHRLCGDPLRSKMKKKMSSLSRETRLCVKQWELHRLPFLMDFALWMHREKCITASTDLAALKIIRGRWLTYQDKFKEVLLAQLERQQQRLTARPSSVSTLDVSRHGEWGSSSLYDDNDTGTAPAHSDGPASPPSQQPPDEEAGESVDPIMLVGPQGCGKSTMARILYALLEEAGAAPRWLNQDEVGNRTSYLAAIRRAMSRGTYSHILLDKMNLDDKTRGDYAEIGAKPVLVVVWQHASGREAFVEACYDRVLQRGACHRTFFHADPARPPASASAQVSPSVSSRSPELRPAATPTADMPVVSTLSSTSVGVPPSWLSSSASPVSPASLPTLSSPSPNASFSPSRLRGILEASARRYQAPASMPCVELDITWDCKHAVAVVWEALRDKGTCELPPLSELDVNAALQAAYAYERLLKAYPTRVASAVLRGPSGDSLLTQLDACRPPAIPKTQRVQPLVEVLLHDFQLNPSPTALVRYARQIGCTRSLTVQAVVSNSKVVLLLVLGPSEYAAAAAAATEKDTSAARTTALRTENAMPVVTVETRDEIPEEEEELKMSCPQEQFAVLAKAKKVTVEYCEALAQRVRDDPEADPYCTVRWLSPPLVLDFEVAFAFP